MQFSPSTSTSLRKASLGRDEERRVQEREHSRQEAEPELVDLLNSLAGEELLLERGREGGEKASRGGRDDDSAGRSDEGKEGGRDALDAVVVDS